MPLTASNTDAETSAVIRVEASGLVCPAITVSFMIPIHSSTGSGHSGRVLRRPIETTRIIGHMGTSSGRGPPTHNPHLTPGHKRAVGAQCKGHPWTPTPSSVQHSLGHPDLRVDSSLFLPRALWFGYAYAKDVLRNSC